MVERPEPETHADERTTLLGFLDYYRATLELKCDGLSAEQLADTNVAPSPLSLLGLVRHMADVELGWFRHLVGGAPKNYRYYDEGGEDPDLDFHGAVADQAVVDDAFDAWHAEIAHAREVIAGRSLDDTFVSSRTGEVFSLRWVLVHMIEEYARHCGHADFLRERIDGATGD